MELNTAYLQQQLNRLPPLTHYHVAFSGGQDSHVLLHLLAGLRQQQPGLNISAIHIHHGLQEQADNWATHCKKVGGELNTDVQVIHVTVNKEGSLEAAAREARYQAFKQIIKPGEGLLLAHHLDDQAETLLLQLFRGAGVAGLSAMPVVTTFAEGWLLRPLLDVPRKLIKKYADTHHLCWIDDPTNLDTSFDRNYLRHRVLPLLSQRWPSLTNTLSRAASHQAEAAALLDVMAEQDYQQCKGSHQKFTTLSVSSLKKLGAERQRNLLRYWLRQVCHLPLPDTRHMLRIQSEVLTASSDATPLVEWQGIELRRYRNELYAKDGSREQGYREAYMNQYPWDLLEPFFLPDGSMLLPELTSGIGMKASLMGKANIRVGFRKGGEQCRPVGRRHHHSLKKLMQEWGVPPWMRERVPLIFVGDEIAQVVGFCLCEPFQARDDEKGVFISQTDV
ncbi:MAG: tRNA lysidine(34) synthetase TilS [Gammaproteobacteria bacterium]